MFRRPKYLEIPCEVHWQQEETEPHRHSWWMMALLILAAIFVIGVGVTSSIK
jgi:antibiotic biosynthesis monooxygenase (ABM) superfamily enzyme